MQRTQPLSPKMKTRLKDYAAKGGTMLVSGSYLCGNDDTYVANADFFNSVLHLNTVGSRHLDYNSEISGMGTSFEIYTTFNEEHYAATAVNMLSPVSPAFTSLTDNEGNGLCVAYSDNKSSVLTMGFPFECIKQANKRDAVMKGIMTFLLGVK